MSRKCYFLANFLFSSITNSVLFFPSDIRSVCRSLVKEKAELKENCRGGIIISIELLTHAPGLFETKAWEKKFGFEG